jgi:hypothetical protein
VRQLAFRVQILFFCSHAGLLAKAFGAVPHPCISHRTSERDEKLKTYNFCPVRVVRREKPLRVVLVGQLKTQVATDAKRPPCFQTSPLGRVRPIGDKPLS